MVNFINDLYAAFTHADPESVTFQLSHKYLFILLGSACVKAAQKMLMKLTPGVTVLDIEVVEAFAGVVILPVRVDAVGAVLLLGVV